MTMGTASTMACMAEALGISLPTGAAIPAADARRRTLANMAGACIVRMVLEDLRISKIITRKAIENSIILNAAVGGSTHFIIHLLAIAGRLGIDLSLEDFDRLSANVPLLANLMPSGQYLMEDFFYAGGLPVVISELKDRLHEDCLTVNGRTLLENCVEAVNYNEDVIRPARNPLQQNGGTAVCRGNLAANGALIKPSAATPSLMKHRGRAVVFEDIEDYHARIDNPDLDVDETCVLVLKMAGPKGYPGMPEVGNLGLPRKVLDRGITDMVRISDGRMSGTAYGTVFLHVAPEAAEGGTLAFVKNGDMIDVDVANRILHLDISDEELAARRAVWRRPAPDATRGYTGLYFNHVLGADRDADLDFHIGSSGSVVTRDSQ